MIIRQTTRQIALMMLLLLSAAGCRDSGDTGSVPAPDAEAPESAPEAAVSYACMAPDGEQFAFTTRRRADSVDMWLPNRFERRRLTLPVTSSDSTATVFGGENASVRIAGSDALLSVDGRDFAGCVEDRPRSIWADARLRGVNLRAVGNEPGWYLELSEGGQVRFVFDYGEREAIVPTPEPTVDAASRVSVYHAMTADYDLLVEVEDLTCTDSMSGQEFSRTVTVEFEGRVFFGCGGEMTSFIGQP